MNLITEPISTSSYYIDYINTIKQYKMQNQKGIFVRYYNINVSASSNSSPTSSSMDVHSDSIFDIYEYTPIWGMDEITDTSEDNIEKMGYAFDGVSSITVHSIAHPRIHDIVSFVYPPFTSEHAYRVRGISTSLNSRDANLYVFKLELENTYNITDLSTLSVADNYVYSMATNTNIFRSKYERIISEQVIISNALSLLLFDNNIEMYYYISGGSRIYPLDSNSVIFNMLELKTIRQYFGSEVLGSFIVPWGVSKYTTIAPDSYLDNSTGTVITGDGVISQSSVVDVMSYSNSTPDMLVQDCAKLLSLFQGK